MLLVPAVCAFAQSPREITLSPVVELGTDDDLAVRSYSFAAIRLPSGRFVVAPQFGKAQLALYAPNGTVIRLHDKEGEGPGELRMHISHLLPVRDTVLAVERNRLLLFDSDLRFIRETRLEFSPNAAGIASPRRLVLNYPLLRTGGATFASHLVDWTGAIVRSVDTVVAGRTAQAEAARVYAASTKGGFWVARRNSSRIEYFDSAGVSHKTINVDRGRFMPWSGSIRSEGFMERPRPRVVGLRETPDGMLAVIIRVADANWRRQEREPVINGSFDFNQVYDSVIEIVDPSTGRVVAAGRVADQVRFVLGSADLVASTRDVPSGDIRVVVWRMQYD